MQNQILNTSDLKLELFRYIDNLSEAKLKDLALFK